MGKSLFSLFIVLMIFAAACAPKAPAPDVMEKKEVMEITPAAPATGEAAVDAVGDDLTNVNTVENDLSTDELGDLDSGLADVQNI